MLLFHSKNSDILCDTFGNTYGTNTYPRNEQTHAGAHHILIMKFVEYIQTDGQTSQNHNASHTLRGQKAKDMH